MSTKNPKVENRSQATQSLVRPHPSPGPEEENYNKRQEGATGTGSTFEHIPDGNTGQVERSRVIIPKKEFS